MSYKNETDREYHQRYWREHREKMKKQHRAYWNKWGKNPINKEKQRKANRDNYHENREDRLIQQKEYYREHPEQKEKKRQRDRDRRLRLRFIIFQRDKFTCQYCGRKAPNVILEIDHRFPKSKGGKGNPENYITSCKECNVGKGDIILDEF